MKYEVTIGIPVFRTKAYIGKTLESVLAQHFDDIEVLVIDDCGDDGSMAVVQQFQREHPRGKHIRILSNDKNRGVSYSRNRIIDEAQGHYLYFLDSDDTIREDTISLMMENIHRYDADIVLGSFQKLDKGKVLSIYQYPDAQFLSQDELGVFSYRCYAGIQASACNFLVKTGILRDHNLRFFPVNFWEDMIFTLDLVALPLRAVMLSDITYNYIAREGSLSQQSHFTKAEIFKNFSAIEHLKQNSLLLRDKPFYPGRCYVAVMTDFYIICNLMKNCHAITPPISDGELMSFMTHPAALSDIMHFRQQRVANIFLWLLCQLPSPIGIKIIKLVGKLKGLM